MQTSKLIAGVMLTALMLPLSVQDSFAGPGESIIRQFQNRRQESMLDVLNQYQAATGDPRGKASVIIRQLEDTCSLNGQMRIGPGLSGFEAQVIKGQSAYISQTFPGSNFNCLTLSGSIVNGSETYVYQNRNLRRLSYIDEKTNVQVNITGDGYDGSLAQCVDNVGNYLSFRYYDLAHRIKVLDVKLPLSVGSGGTFLGADGKGYNLNRNELLQVIELAYTLTYSDQMPSLNYAQSLVSDVSFRDAAVNSGLEILQNMKKTGETLDTLVEKRKEALAKDNAEREAKFAAAVKTQAEENLKHPDEVIRMHKGVTLTHKKHFTTLNGCTACHGNSTPGPITERSKEWAHTTCKGCHTTMGKGPVKCGDCHK